MLCPAEAEACTSIVVSGKATASGRPLLLKVRDNDISKSNTNIQYFKGDRFDFISSVANTTEHHDNMNASFGGYNSAGLCMASLTSHGFPLEKAKNRCGGGELLHKALGNCRNLGEFEALARRIMEERPIVTNIGAIDAEGAAACYEFGGHTFKKYDVNDPACAPEGYRAIANFAFSGDMSKGTGKERYDSAMESLAATGKNADGKYDIDHTDILENVVRSFRHPLRGVEKLEDIKDEYYSHQGFIVRFTTNSAYIFEGVRPGEDPKHTVMWVNLGNPCCAPSLPLVLGNRNLIPECIWEGDCISSDVCHRAMHLRNKFIFDKPDMMNVRNISLLMKQMRRIEAPIRRDFVRLHDSWVAGRITDNEFYSAYTEQGKRWFKQYVNGTPE